MFELCRAIAKSTKSKAEAKFTLIMPSGSRFKVASKREQNKFIYYVEREQLRRSQDDKVGLKEKGDLRSLMS